MTPVRIIARLDIKGPNVVKGICFEGLRIMGLPNELAQRYYHAGADEILFIDTVASLYGRDNILHIVEAAARDVFVPMTVGGGIRSVDDIVQVLRSGADRIAVNTAAIQRPGLIREAADAFGSQCVVLSVEAKRQGPGRWEAYTDNGRERTGLDVLDWVVRAEDLGAGEVLLTSVDREGTRTGIDIDLIAAVARRVEIPVIASGGVGSVTHVLEVVENTGIDAVACASVFHYGQCSIANVKQALIENGVPVRP